MDVVKVASDKVQITLDTEEAARLSATLHFLGSPLSRVGDLPIIEDLQPLADAVFEAFTG